MIIRTLAAIVLIGILGIAFKTLSTDLNNLVHLRYNIGVLLNEEME